MEAAYQAGKKAGVEAAIKVIEEGRFLHDDSPPKRFAIEVVAAIRRELCATPRLPYVPPTIISKHRDE